MSCYIQQYDKCFLGKDEQSSQKHHLPNNSHNKQQSAMCCRRQKHRCILSKVSPMRQCSSIMIMQIGLRKKYPQRWCGLNVCIQSALFISQTYQEAKRKFVIAAREKECNLMNMSQLNVWLTLTVQSLEAVITRVPSLVKMASFTYDACPRNSFNNFPDFRP